MTQQIQIVDEYGALREIPEAEMSGLDQNKRARLSVLQTAIREERDANLAQKSATAAVVAAVSAIQDARLARDLSFPKPDRLDELRRMGMWQG